MKTTSCFALLLVAVPFVSWSCSGGGDDDTPPPPAFLGDSLVLDAVQHTSDTSDPVEINGQHITFSEDPHAFDSVFH